MQIITPHNCGVWRAPAARLDVDGTTTAYSVFAVHTYSMKSGSTSDRGE